MHVTMKDNGSPPTVWIARISYEHADGLHIFTSNQILGLLVASRNARQAIDQLVPTITALIKANDGRELTVELGKEFTPLHKEGAGNSLSLKDAYAVIRQAA